MTLSLLLNCPLPAGVSEGLVGGNPTPPPLPLTAGGTSGAPEVLPSPSLGLEWGESWSRCRLYSRCEWRGWGKTPTIPHYRRRQRGPQTRSSPLRVLDSNGARAARAAAYIAGVSAGDGEKPHNPTTGDGSADLRRGPTRVWDSNGAARAAAYIAGVSGGDGEKLPQSLTTGDGSAARSSPLRVLDSNGARAGRAAAYIAGVSAGDSSGKNPTTNPTTGDGSADFGRPRGPARSETGPARAAAAGVSAGDSSGKNPTTNPTTGDGSADLRRPRGLARFEPATRMGRERFLCMVYSRCEWRG